MKKTVSLLLAVLLVGAASLGAWEPDAEYNDWQWWLARSADGGWDLLTWGFG